MTGVDLLLWVPIVGTIALAIGTLIFAYWQLRQNQRLHSATTLLDLRERFYAARFVRARKQLSAWLLGGERGEEPDNWEVAIFFELLGSLTRSGILERRLVQNAFGTWITSYYTFITRPVNLFERWRAESNDQLIFADFEWLARRIIDQERSLSPSPTFDKELLEEARYVLEGESRVSEAS